MVIELGNFYLLKLIQCTIISTPNRIINWLYWPGQILVARSLSKLYFKISIRNKFVINLTCYKGARSTSTPFVSFFYIKRNEFFHFWIRVVTPWPQFDRFIPPPSPVAAFRVFFRVTKFRRAQNMNEILCKRYKCNEATRLHERPRFQQQTETLFKVITSVTKASLRNNYKSTCTAITRRRKRTKFSEWS